MSIPALVSALAPVRDKFVQQYDAWIAQMRKEHPSGAPELAVKLGPHTGLVRQLYRVDYAIGLGTPPEFREMQLVSNLAFAPWSGQVGSLMLNLNPFRWNGVVVDLETMNWNEDLLLPWFDKWFGIINEELRAPEAERSSGLLHAVTLDGSRVHVDLGSAPADAIAELIALAQQHGAAQATVKDAAQHTSLDADIAAGQLQ